MRTYYIVITTYHSYYNEIHGTPGHRKPEGIFETLKEAEDFIESAPDYDFKSDSELYYKILPVELDILPKNYDED